MSTLRSVSLSQSGFVVISRRVQYGSILQVRFVLGQTESVDAEKSVEVEAKQFGRFFRLASKEHYQRLYHKTQVNTATGLLVTALRRIALCCCRNFGRLRGSAMKLSI